jgi:putative endonuclease
LKQYYVYILASKRNGTLCVGVTNDLIRRVFEHKNALADGFTNKYGVKNLVYYEQSDSQEGQAVLREKQIKEWRRKWKLALIGKSNPEWKNLYNDIL